MVTPSPLSKKKDVTIIGAGPAGLFAAEIIAKRGHRVTIYEQLPSPARKFLFAGRGGLNLTHSEPLDRFLARYGRDAAEVRAAVEAYPSKKLIAWANSLGAETFVGSSGRIFPRAMKASPLLRAWLQRLSAQGVELRTRHRWTGFAENGGLTIENAERSTILIEPDAAILALGGASWPKLGSDARWIEILKDAAIAVAPLEPANCGVLISWSKILLSRFEGTALKRIALTVGGETARGEAILTRHGLEGGALYPLVPLIRETLKRDGSALLVLDLKPDLAVADLTQRLAKPRGKETLTAHLRKAARLDPSAIAVLRESALPEDAEALARRIKSLPLNVTGLAGIDRAISTAGGIAWESVDQNLMLKARPGVFVAGEMLDWEAPTGGYLLQATFATAARAADGVLAWLAAEK